MTTISATIIADSIAPSGKRLTTMALVYPRFIHAEFMTHRMFSRNASSSRAIPASKLILDIRNDPVIPLFWGKNIAGMQAKEELPEHLIEAAKVEWLAGMELAIDTATAMLDLYPERGENEAPVGVHKQIVNRILEPYAHIRVLVSATEWANFFALRDHPDAEPHIQRLAQEMKKAMAESTPRLLTTNQWHLPFVEPEDVKEAHDTITHNGVLRVHPSQEQMSEILLKISVARCARVSYLTHEGKKPVFEEDLKLWERLVGSAPLHASPAEHQGTPDEYVPTYPKGSSMWQMPETHGNFVGWIQYRKLLSNENVAG